MKLISILLWPPVMALKIFLALLGVVIVPLGMWTDSVPKLYESDNNRPWTCWEMIVRNPVNNFKKLVAHPYSYSGYGTPDPDKLEKKFAWRFRHYGLLSSIRLVWLYNEKKYGEFYLGWKLGSAKPDLDFAMQLRVWADVGN